MKKNYNILLTMLSGLKKDNMRDTTYSERIKNTDKKYTGVMTNEAGIKYIIDELQSEDDYIDKIMYVSSETVSKLDSFSFGDKSFESQKQFFEAQINDYCQDSGIKDLPEFVSYNVSDIPTTTELQELSTDIMTNILNDSDKIQDNINLYVESNGGFRDFIVIIGALIQTLDAKVNLKMVTGVAYIEREGTIVDKTDAFKIYKLYSGVNEFINYGKNKELEEFFKTEKKPRSKEIKNVIDAIGYLSDSFTLCLPVKMLENIEKLKIALDSYENSANKSKLFSYVSDRINAEYASIFNKIDKSNIKSYAALKELINYCVEHGLIQQALTLYGERMPKCLYELEIAQESREETYMKDFYEFKRKENKNKGYVFIQKYMCGKRHVQFYKSKNINSKIEFSSEWGKQSRGMNEKKIKEMLDRNAIDSKYDDHSLVAVILADYKEIKGLRNNSNHSSNINDYNMYYVNKTLINGIKHIDQLIK